MAKLLLFDIDGTLMEESPTHTASFNYVCNSIYGVTTDIDSFPRHGMTDTGILYGLLKKENVEDDQIRNGMKKAFSAMAEYVSANLKPDDYKLLENVGHILERLHNTTPVATAIAFTDASLAALISSGVSPIRYISSLSMDFPNLSMA